MRRALLAALLLVGLYGCYDYSLDPVNDAAEDAPKGKQGKSSGDDSLTPSSVESNASSSSSGGAGTNANPPATPSTEDAGTDATTTQTSNGCSSNGMFCGGDALLRCNADGSRTFVGKCANGCVNGACNPATPCVSGGTYCGGDKVNGDPDVLYKCGADGVATTVQEHCANGCFVAPAGSDDYCK
jgi:hypothetical protein